MSASHRSPSRKVRNPLRHSPGPHPRRLILEQLEDRRLLAGDALVGVDINMRPNSAGSEPHKFVDVDGTVLNGVNLCVSA